MLFTAPEFLFVFLPLTLVAVWFAAGRIGRGAALGIVLVASFVFYGWRYPEYVALLAGSVLGNFLLGRALKERPSTALMAAGIALNLAVLGYFKYRGFFVSVANGVGGTDWTVSDLALPLAISFFTFQQIAFLVDVRRGLVGDIRLRDYSLFVTFFPQLIAGPIVHHKEIIDQLHGARVPLPVRAELIAGIAIFAVGLIKKVLVADSLAPYVDSVFAQPASSLGIVDAWGGVLAYAFQIYFDFSGYSDMAIGMGLFFGIRLPLNFASPYKAESIIDFWRSWHVTLSRFLRDYLYLPLGGNRHGRVRRHVNLMIVMTLGGLWHGAGWTFVFWGFLHGLYLIINHVWRRVVPPPAVASPLRRAAGRIVTFLAVLIAWVFFRAADFGQATEILSAMAGMTAGDGTAILEPQFLAWLGVLLAVVWLAPATQDWFPMPADGSTDHQPPSVARLLLRAALLVWFCCALLLVIYRVGEPPAFIYFQF